MIKNNPSCDCHVGIDRMMNEGGAILLYDYEEKAAQTFSNKELNREDDPDEYHA